MMPYGQASVRDWLQLSIKTSMIVMQAQVAMGMQMLGWMGLWRATPGDDPSAAPDAAAALIQTAPGEAPETLSAKTSQAKPRPVERRSRAPVSRLAPSGPGLPSSDA